MDQNQKEFDTLIYKLCEGKGRTRAKISGGLREQGTWHNTILATGEQPIVSSGSRGGAHRRVINLKCDKPLFSGNKEEIAKLRNIINQNYGTAGRAFVVKLLEPENMTRAKALVEEYRSQIAQTEDGAQNLQGALILAADTLATEWIFQDNVKLTVDDMIQYLKNDEQINSNERAHEYLKIWIGRNGKLLPLEKGSDSAAGMDGRYLKRGGQIVCALFPDRFERAMRTGGFNADAYIQWAVTNGKLSTDKEQTKPNVRFNMGGTGKLIRCVCVIVDEDQGTEELDESQEETV